MNPTGPVAGVVFPERADDAPWAMALDDAMLELAQDGLPSLRVYSWPGPNLTLGYFQKAAVRKALGHEALPWARRASGGEALLHHHEWTYSFALPANHPLASCDALSLTQLVHRSVGAWLQQMGVRARLHEEGDLYRGKSGLCFEHFSRGDLLLGDFKIMGSAQRRRKGTLLQHGGLLLRQSPAESRLLGIADLERTFVADARLGPGLTEVLTRALGGTWQFADEISTADWLARGKRWAIHHESPTWREKR